MAAYLRETLLRSGVLAGLICTAVSAEAQAPLPDLSSNGVGWIAINRDFVAVPGSPRPVADDPAHLYLPSKPTFRVADLTNPNLKPWARDIMRRENEKVLAGGIGYTPRSSCMPAGVPAFMLFPVVEPIYFHGLTLEQAAASVGVSRSWAHRVHVRALEIMQRELRRRARVVGGDARARAERVLSARAARRGES